jgi:hypothetical protein
LVDHYLSKFIGDPRDRPAICARFISGAVIFAHRQRDNPAALSGSDHIILGTDDPFDLALPKAVKLISGAKLARIEKAAWRRSSRRCRGANRDGAIDPMNARTAPGWPVTPKLQIIGKASPSTATLATSNPPPQSCSAAR